MAFAGFHLPNIQNADLSSDKDRRKILEYLYQLTEQLRFVLSNIDEDNLNPKFREEIENNETVNALSTRVENAETGVYSLRKQTAEGFSQMVRKDGVVSAINQTAELIQIAAAKIALEGYVSINGAFSVDEGGFMRATGGTIGGWNIVPNMLLGGPTSEINSGKIVGTSLYGVNIYSSNGIYIDSGNAAAPSMEPDGFHGGKFTNMASTLNLHWPVPGATLNGDMFATDFIQSSDKRLKKDLRPLGVNEAKKYIMGFKPVGYRFKSDDEHERFGFIAQESPEAFRRRHKNTEGEECLALDYTGIIAPLVKVVQEQEKRITALEAVVAELRKEG